MTESLSPDGEVKWKQMMGDAVNIAASEGVPENQVLNVVHDALDYSYPGDDMPITGEDA